MAGVFTAGRYVEAPRFRAMSYDLLDAFVVNWAYTSVLKAAVGRERPNGQDQKSFPSGHASNAFALAAVVERHYGWKAGLPAYAVASAGRGVAAAAEQALPERRPRRGHPRVHRGANGRPGERAPARRAERPAGEPRPRGRPEGARARGFRVVALTELAGVAR